MMKKEKPDYDAQPEPQPAEVIPTPQTQLVTFSPTLAQIAELKDKYSPLSAESKEGYEEVRKALGIMIRHRTGVEARRKQLVADALEYQRSINGKAKDLTALLEEIENPLREKKKKIDDAEEAAILAKLKAEDDAKKAKEEAERQAKEAELKAIRDAQEAEIQKQRAKLAQEQAALAQERKKAQEEHERIRMAEESKRKTEQARIDAENARQAEEHRKARAQLEAEIAADRKARAEAEAKAQAERDRFEAERRALIAEKEAMERTKREAQEKIDRELFQKAAMMEAEKKARHDAEQLRLANEAKAKAEKEAAAAEAKRIEAARPDLERIRALGNFLLSGIDYPTVKNVEGNNFVKHIKTSIESLAGDCVNFTISKKGKP